MTPPNFQIHVPIHGPPGDTPTPYLFLGRTREHTRTQVSGGRKGAKGTPSTHPRTFPPPTVSGRLSPLPRCSPPRTRATHQTQATENSDQLNNKLN